MLKTIEIHVYETKKDHLGSVSEAGRLSLDLDREIEEAGFRGMPPMDMVIDLTTTVWHSSLVENALVHGGGIKKGTKIFVWK